MLTHMDTVFRTRSGPIAWSVGDTTTASGQWKDPSPKPRAPRVAQLVSPLSEAAEERLYATGKEDLRIRRGPPVDKTERRVGFGSSSPPRIGPGSRQIADESQEPVVGLAKRRGDGQLPVSPSTETAAAVAVRKVQGKRSSTDAPATPETAKSLTLTKAAKTSAGGSGSKRKAGAAANSKKSVGATKRPSSPPLPASEDAEEVASGSPVVTTEAGAELLDIIEDARNAIDNNRPIITPLRNGDHATGTDEVAPDPESVTEPEPAAALEPAPAPEPEPVKTADDVGGPGKYRVLAAATVREGSDGDSKKVGEFKKGTTIDVVHAQTNANGMTVLQTITAPPGKKRGGWVKLVTSKGKQLLERLEDKDPVVKKSPEKPEPEAPPPVQLKQDDPLLLPQADEIEPESDSEAEPEPSNALSATRVADVVDEKVRKAILGEKMAATTQDEMVLDEEDVVEPPELQPAHSPARSPVTEEQLAEDLTRTDDMSSEELLSKMEDFLNFDSAVNAVGPALDSTEAWATHYAQVGAESGPGSEVASPQPEAAPELEPAAALEPAPAPEPEPVKTADDVGGPGKYRVLAAATVREGSDGDSKKVGEFKKGTTIDVVHAQTNANGMTVLQTITAPPGKKRGGWVKLVTSKGKQLLERLEQERDQPVPASPAPSTAPTLGASELQSGATPASRSSTVSISVMCPFSHEAGQPITIDTDNGPVAVHAPDGIEPGDMFEAVIDVGVAGAASPSGSLDDLYEQMQSAGSPQSTTVPASPSAADAVDASTEEAAVDEGNVGDGDNGGEPRPDLDIGKWLDSLNADPDIEDAFLEAEIDTLGDLAEVATTKEALESYLPTSELQLEGWKEVSRIHRSTAADNDDDGDREVVKDSTSSMTEDEERFRAEQKALGLGSSSDSADGQDQDQQDQDAAGSSMMSIICPEGSRPGQSIVVEGPDGKDIEVLVPTDVKGGDVFEVDVSAVGRLVSVSSAQTMTVTVPDGVSAGDPILITAPDGTDLEVVVPDGLGAGEEFEIEIDI